MIVFSFIYQHQVVRIGIKKRQTNKRSQKALKKIAKLKTKSNQNRKVMMQKLKIQQSAMFF